MKKLLTLTGLMMALAVMAAPEEYVTQSASGSTAATVYFEPGLRPASLVVADVTSDKTTSVLNWRVGGQQVTVLKAVPAAGISNILTTVSASGAINHGTNLLSVTTAGTVTAHLASTNYLVTNKLVTLQNPIGTNLAVGDIIRERTGTPWAISSTSSSNVATLSRYGTFAAGDRVLLLGLPNEVEVQGVATYATNSGAFNLTVTNGFAFTPRYIYTLTTNIYTTTFLATGTGSTLVLDGSTGLAVADQIVISPATGGGVLRQIAMAEAYIYQETWIGAATGIALAVGDRLFALGSNINTPVGNASLRLSGDPLRVIPANVPARLQVDGTTACAINAAIVHYPK